MTEFLLWKTFSKEQLAALQEEYEVSAQSAATFKSNLGKVLGHGGEGETAEMARRNAIIIDFHFYNIAFAKRAGFTQEKVSTFCSIMQTLLETDMGAKFRTVDESFAELKGMLLRHSVQRPPWSIGIFSKDDVKSIVDFVANGYIRHFKLYRYCLSPRPELTLTQKNRGNVEVP